ncbi:MAG: DUF294 nucleotidyltransferase-like domain-containing protein [Magnetospirillum sp. WYHS-4]
MELDTKPLKALDSFPYRHRIRDVMNRPVRTIGTAATVHEASQVMTETKISSLVVVDDLGQALGIVTERDVLRAVARSGGQGLKQPVSIVMGRPLQSVSQDAFVYTALGRMDRLNVRHLVAVDERQQPTGMVTARTLLKLRSSNALAIGDEVSTAQDAAQMDAVRKRLPELIANLLAEGVDGLSITAVISAVLCDTTARAAELAVDGMRQEGWGDAPASWSLLVLGSGGRGEAMLGADQDNAIVHTGDESAAPWFGELARRITTALDGAGVPFCKGDVMVTNPQWRRSLSEWQEEITGWVRGADGSALLNIDIFLDFRPVFGDLTLAENLRDELISRARVSAPFLHALAGTVSDINPLGLFNRFKLVEGKLDLKRNGVWPIVNTVRLLALKHGISVASTRDRLRALCDGKHIPCDEAQRLIDTHEMIARILLRHQAALAAGNIAGQRNMVDPAVLTRGERARLKEAFKHLKDLHWVINNALSSV